MRKKEAGALNTASAANPITAMVLAEATSTTPVTNQQARKRERVGLDNKQTS